MSHQLRGGISVNKCCIDGEIFLHFRVICSNTTSSGFRRNSGPSIHLRFTRSSAFSPREASLAGFRNVGTYLHCAISKLSLMAVTLFATMVWNLQFSFFIYFRTDMLSVQKQVLFSGSWSSKRSILSTLTATTAAVSSNQGMVMGLRGATLALPN